MTQTNKYDVLIIGSGISALTSAALLSKKGKSVLVLEQYSKPGGYMHSFKRFGELYDTGAHYVGALGPGQPFHTLLNYLGVWDPSVFTPLDREAFDVFKFPEGQVNIPVGYEQVISELSATFPTEKDAIRNYFHMVRDVVRYFPTYNFNDALELDKPIESLDVSLQAVVEKLTSNPKLQSVLYAYCSLHGVMPWDVSFGLHAIMVDSLILGPMGFSQGGDALAQKFVDRIQANGGKVLTKRKVTSLVIQNDNVHEIKTENGETYQAEWVISSIHPKATFKLLSDDSRLTPAFRKRLAEIKESDGIFGVYAYCKDLQNMKSHRNYYYFKSSDPKKLFHVEKSNDVPVVFASMSRSSTGKENSQTLSLHSLAPYEWFKPWRDSAYGKRCDEYKKFKDNIAEGLFDLVGQYEEGFRSRVDKFVTSTPLTNLYFNGSEEGSGYGIYHSIQNTGARALGPRTKVINLLLTGQNCLFPGLLGASVSALRTCGHVIGIKSVLGELQKLSRQNLGGES
jgi:all-trans-retinol 13,14-reductase